MDIIDRSYHKSVTVVPRAMTDDQGAEYYEFELSNDEVDSHRTAFRVKGMRIDEFNTDPIVTYGHPSFDSTDPDDVIGTGPVYVSDGKLIGRFYPEGGDDNQKAKKVVTKIKQGLIRSASIVAEITKHRRGRKDLGESPEHTIFEESNILCWGIVMKGSNPKAKLRTQARAMELYNSAEPQETDTHTQDTAQLTAESLLTEQRLRLMKLDINSSTAAQ